MTVLLDKGQTSIRIRKRLRALYDKEAHKNRLINDLLEQYYQIQNKL